MFIEKKYYCGKVFLVSFEILVKWMLIILKIIYKDGKINVVCILDVWNLKVWEFVSYNFFNGLWLKKDMLIVFLFMF